MRVAVLADTHLRDGDPRQRDLPLAAWERLAGSEVILHAGDVLGPGTLERLNEVAPTYAVLGNNDVGLAGQLPVTRLLTLDGVRVGMVHDTGERRGRAERVRRRFPDADVVVFGHSHIPCDELGVEGQVLFNPGSPTTRRAQPTRTMGELVLVEGRCVRRLIVDLGP